MRQCRCNVSLMLKSISRKKKSVFPIEKFQFLLLARNTTLQDPRDPLSNLAVLSVKWSVTGG